MTRGIKVRKVNDDLYEQDFQRDDGERSLFRWEREFENVHVTLSNLRCIYSALVEIGEIGRSSSQDVATEDSYIIAQGDIDNGGLSLINEEHFRTRRTLNRVELRAYSGNWNDLVQETRKASAFSSKFHGFGELRYFSTEDQDAGYVEKGDEFSLSLRIPKPIFERIFAQLKSENSSIRKVRLSARIGLFRSEVDKALEEHWHFKDFSAGRISPAYFSHFDIEYRPQFSAIDEGTKIEVSEGESADLEKTATKKRDAVASWLQRIFFAVLVLIAVVLFKL